MEHVHRIMLPKAKMCKNFKSLSNHMNALSCSIKQIPLQIGKNILSPNMVLFICSINVYYGQAT